MFGVEGCVDETWKGRGHGVLGEQSDGILQSPRLAANPEIGLGVVDDGDEGIEDGIERAKKVNRWRRGCHLCRARDAGDGPC